MKKIYHILFLALVACMGLASCSSDDVTKTPLDSPSITQGAAKVSSLAFSWKPVSGATQYAYELYNPDGTVNEGGVTSATSYIATSLSPNTTYTLKVWAYAALSGDKTTSPIATLQATTNAPAQLESPVPTYSSANGSVTISWPVVDHASGYSYSFTSPDGETVKGEVEDNSVTLTSLPVGQYTISIMALSDSEEYTASPVVSLTFERAKAEVWRKTGSYQIASTGETCQADIVYYDDNSYTIEAPYGETGYGISFSVPEGGTEISPLATAEGGYYPFWVGSSSYVYIYTSGGYSSFEGDKDKGGVWFYTLYYKDRQQVGSGGYDYFTWGSDQPAEPTVDDLCGTYDAKYEGYDYFSADWSRQEVSGTSESAISKIDDTTVKISNFYNWGEDFTAKVDLPAKTLTIEPVATWGGYYTFADVAASDKAVVGTINDDGTITFKNFTAWYGSYYYIEEGTTCVLTKK